MEADGTFVTPVLLDEIGIAPGERYSVVLEPLSPDPQEGLLRMRLDQA
jgi:FtsP/CotA-like multicopper oxidase with cupredoxin domain